MYQLLFLSGKAPSGYGSRRSLRPPKKYRLHPLEVQADRLSPDFIFPRFRKAGLPRRKMSCKRTGRKSGIRRNRRPLRSLRGRVFR